MTCGICGQPFVDSPHRDELIVLVRFHGEPMFAHLRDCSLDRDGSVART